MKKKVFLGSLVILSTILVSSCGSLSDEDSPEACSFAVSQAIDKGNYDYVIQKLESDITCGGAYTQEEGRIQLAAAYIGKAGFDITTLVNDMITSGNNNQDTFAVFTQAIAKRAKGESVNYLTKAKNLYSEIYGNIDCGDKNQIANLPDIVKDACFYSGLVDTAKATISLALLIGGDETDTNQIAELVEYWVNTDNNTQMQCSETDINLNGIPDSADATACALEYATKVSSNEINLGDVYSCSNGAEISAINQNVIFDNLNTNFTNLVITISPSNDCPDYQAQTYKRLIYDIGNNIYSTTVTSGYCYTNFNQCDKNEDNCYPCPVITEDKNQEQVPASTADVIIETINEGTDAIVAVIPNQDEADLKQTIIDFKKDLCSAEPQACLCDINGDGIYEEDCNDENTVNNAQDIIIKKPTEDPIVQQLIADYLLNK